MILGATAKDLDFYYQYKLAPRWWWWLWPSGMHLIHHVTFQASWWFDRPYIHGITVSILDNHINKPAIKQIAYELYQQLLTHSNECKQGHLMAFQFWSRNYQEYVRHIFKIQTLEFWRDFYFITSLIMWYAGLCALWRCWRLQVCSRLILIFLQSI
jgi:hypothetical protein